MYHTGITPKTAKINRFFQKTNLRWCATKALRIARCSRGVQPGVPTIGVGRDGCAELIRQLCLAPELRYLT
jgi:hypothetical protein